MGNGQSGLSVPRTSATPIALPASKPHSELDSSKSLSQLVEAVRRRTTQSHADVARRNLNLQVAEHVHAAAAAAAALDLCGVHAKLAISLARSRRHCLESRYVARTVAVVVA